MGRADFEALYRAEFPNVFRTAFLIAGDRQEALNLTQEAFARTYERWRAVRRARNPAAWVQRVVANLAISSHRRRLVRERYSTRSTEAVVPAPETPEPELLAALRTLTPAQRGVIVLRYFADRSIEDVAEALGKRPGTVTALTSQGLARLREQLKEGVIDEARG